MTHPPLRPLRRGWTTGACATAATKAALAALWGGGFRGRVTSALPRGKTPDFAVAMRDQGAGWAVAGIIKDAGDDPDVTHGVMVCARNLHSGRSHVDFAQRADWMQDSQISNMNISFQPYEYAELKTENMGVEQAFAVTREILNRDDIQTNIVITNRAGNVITTVGTRL